MQSVKLISATEIKDKTLLEKGIKDLSIYIARVSSSKQDNLETDKLTQYLVNHKHWSPFEHVYATFEIKTSRAIETQLIRHRSFTFQSWSSRYQKADYQEFMASIPELRLQAEKNRQSSEEVVKLEDQDLDSLISHWNGLYKFYSELIDKGVAKECARMFLPLGTPTKIYMTGNIRSWIHFLQVRNHKDAQLEIQEIAQEIQNQLEQQYEVFSYV